MHRGGLEKDRTSGMELRLNGKRVGRMRLELMQGMRVEWRRVGPQLRYVLE